MKRVYNKQYILLIYVILSLATVIAFEPVRHNGFVNYDDYEYLTENPHVKDGINRQSVIWAFTTSQSGNWHPLTWLSHMLDWKLFGFNPSLHHLTSLLFHIANTLLLFYVLKRMTGEVWPSAFVAAAFALHPFHVESVAWAAERKDVLSSFFWMLTMIAYVRYAQRPCAGRYLLVVLALCLGLMSKPMVVTLPLVLLLLDYWPLARLNSTMSSEGETYLQSQRAKITCESSSAWRLIAEKIPLFILVTIASAITLRFQQIAGAIIVQVDLPLNFRIANALISYARYIGKMIYPNRLAVFYPTPVGSPPTWPIIISFLIVVCISMGVIYMARRHRYLAVGWLWYLGTLVPVIGLVQVGGQAMADRYTYLPSIGIFIMVAWGAAELLSRWRYQKIVLGITAGAALAVLLICTRRQVSCWQDSLTLFAHTLAVTESNYVVHKNYGNVLYERGQLDEAVAQYKEALRIAPLYLIARLNMGKVFLKQGKLDEAIECFNKVLLFKPDYPEAHFQLAMALIEQGKHAGVAEHFNKALKARPQWPEVYYNLGSFYAHQEKYELAIQNYREALRLRPDYPEAVRSLDAALNDRDNVNKGIKR